MEASQVFLNLLRSIEDSQLNYSISRTPFSATISLKSSFLKRFAEASKKGDLENVKNLPRTDSHLEKKVEEAEAEKVALQEEIRELHDTFEKEQKRIMGELVSMKKLYEDEKKRSAALEIEIVDYREEAIKIKKERKELCIKLQVTKDEFEALKTESKILTEKKEVLQKEALDKRGALELRDEEISKTKIENDNLKKALVRLQTELDNQKLSELKQSKVVIKCERCEINVSTYDELNNHYRRYHSHNKASQCENRRNFEPFSCYYCDILIETDDNLEEHYVTCQNEFESVMNQQEVSYDCEFCEAKCQDSGDLKETLD
jgi:chromosome segregation ATPase